MFMYGFNDDEFLKISLKSLKYMMIENDNYEEEKRIMLPDLSLHLLLYVSYFCKMDDWL